VKINGEKGCLEYHYDTTKAIQVVCVEIFKGMTTLRANSISYSPDWFPYICDLSTIEYTWVKSFSTSR
jgi:hypothetical protein